MWCRDVSLSVSLSLCPARWEELRMELLTKAFQMGRKEGPAADAGFSCRFRPAPTRASPLGAGILEVYSGGGMAFCDCLCFCSCTQCWGLSRWMDVDGRRALVCETESRLELGMGDLGCGKRDLRQVFEPSHAEYLSYWGLDSSWEVTWQCQRSESASYLTYLEVIRA